MVQYRTGNLFDFLEPNVAVAHCCNTVGLFGAGFAGEVEKRYPIVKTAFLEWNRERTYPWSWTSNGCVGKPRLGDVQAVSVRRTLDSPDFIVFLNMIGQEGVRSRDNPSPVKYDALRLAMTESLKIIDRIHRDQKIFCPMFGSGLAGGDWNMIEEIIRDVWGNRDVTIFTLKRKDSLHVSKTDSRAGKGSGTGPSPERR